MARPSLSKTLELLDDRTRIVTPQLIPWLESHADDPLPDWVAARVAEILTTPPRDRRGSFSGSSSGQCLRQQEFEFIGAPASQTTRTDASLAAIYNDGDWRHLRWQSWGLTSGILTDIEVPLAWPKMNSRGSLDGEGYVPDDHPNRKWRGEEFGFELKGVNPFRYPKWIAAATAQEYHLRQVHRYFLVSGKKLFVIIYENKGTNQWHEWVIRPNAQMMRESEAELKRLNEAVEMQKLHTQLPSCKIRLGPDWSDCPYAGVQGTCETVHGWWSPPASKRRTRSS